MEHDREQKFVLTTDKWQREIRHSESPLSVYQGYVTTPQAAGKLRDILCQDDFNKLAEIGFYIPQTHKFELNDSALTCRIRTTVPKDKAYKNSAELTVKLYKGNRAENKRAKFPINFGKASKILIQRQATHQTRFLRHSIEHGNQTIEGNDYPLTWKVDTLNGPLDGLVLAKAERQCAPISVVQVFDGNAIDVTDDRNYTGFILGQFNSLKDLRAEKSSTDRRLQPA